MTVNILLSSTVTILMRENNKFCLLELSSLHVKFNLLPGPYGSLDTKEESLSSSRLLT